MVSNADVARAFASKQKLKAGNMFSTGRVVYSYGEHWPIAVWVDLEGGGKVIALNIDKTSQTTSCQTTRVRQAIGNYVEVSHSEAKRLAEGLPATIIKLKYPKTREELRETIRQFMLPKTNAIRASNFADMVLKQYERFQALEDI